ncbi:MAG: TolC family protein [Bacteroidales bacterium]|jgi:outer membrane protein TolC|nr:TolC family protein [Bacteroidales bacterium]
MIKKNRNTLRICSRTASLFCGRTVSLICGRTALFALLLLCTASLKAQTTASQELSLDECRALARKNYPEIKQYDLIRQSEQYTISNAGKSYLPQITLSGQATWQNEVPSFPSALGKMLAQSGMSMSGMDKKQYKVTLEVNQTIWDGGKSSADKKLAQAESIEQQNSADADLYGIEGRVDDLYFGILLLDKRISQTNLTAKLLQSNLDKVHSLLKNGVATQSDADAVEAQLLTVNQQITQLESARDSYELMLGVFIGEDVKGRHLLMPDVTNNGDSTNINTLINLVPQRPEQKMFEAKSNSLAAKEELIKSSTRPKFGLFAQGFYGYPGFDYFQSMMNKNPGWNAIAGVKMVWNFGAYYTRKNDLNKIRTAQQQVNVQNDVFLFNTKLQTTQENGEITRIKKALYNDDKIVSLRTSVRKAAESKLRNGIIDTNDLLGKITDESDAVTARSAREIELVKAIYQLKHLVNR